jgi:hypothetical protein
MDLEEILRYVDGLDKESEEMKAELFKLCWYMRGGVSVDDAFSMTYKERQLIAGIIKENLETSKKTGMPFF